MMIFFMGHSTSLVFFGDRVATGELLRVLTQPDEVFKIKRGNANATCALRSGQPFRPQAVDWLAAASNREYLWING
jgi:hypothetical protein